MRMNFFGKDSIVGLFKAKDRFNAVTKWVDRASRKVHSVILKNPTQHYILQVHPSIIFSSTAVISILSNQVIIEYFSYIFAKLQWKRLCPAENFNEQSPTGGWCDYGQCQLKTPFKLMNREKVSYMVCDWIQSKVKDLFRRYQVLLSICQRKTGHIIFSQIQV